MVFSNFSFKIGRVLFVGSMLMLGWNFFGCQHESLSTIQDVPPTIQDTLPVVQDTLPTLLDSVVGIHDGTCHFLDKDLPTGTINVDTTYESTIEIIRIDADKVIAKGCGAPLYAFSMPAGSSETEFYSQQTSANSQNYTFEIWINLLDRTIRTHSLHSGWPTFYYKENTGMFKF